MISEHIPRLRSHDPGEKLPRNVGIGALLAKLRATFQSVEVTLDASNTDTSLEITSIAFSPQYKLISFLVSGGSVAAQAADPNTNEIKSGYLLHLRIWFTNGLRADRSVWLPMRQH